MNQIQKTNRSFSTVLLGGMLVLASQLFSAKADAQIIPTDSFGCTQTITPIFTCIGAAGYNANNWVGSNKCWIWKINTTGYTGIDMDFQTMKSAAAGPTTGTVSYSTTGPNGPWTTFASNTYTVSTSCGTKHIDLPVGCEGQSVLYIRSVMTGASANTATNRVTSDDLFSGTATGCTGTPAQGGTVSADINPVCAGTSATLSLTGATGGAGITYTWQVSPNGSTWADVVPAATGLTYATPTSLTADMYYRVKVSCGANSRFSDTLALDVVTVPVGPITGYTNPLIVGTTQTLSDTSANGIWVSSNESAISIDETTGVMTGLFGGTADVSYQVSDLVTGCTASKTITVNAVWPNTLALYAGTTGTNRNVINVPGDTTSTLYSVGFGSATACGQGGLSGLTTNPAVDTAYNVNGPHVGFKVYAKPSPDSVLNMYRIHARARTSSTGPKSAVIAYRYWNIFGASSWIKAANVIHLDSSDCNVIKNDWDFNTGIYANPNPTVNGMDSLEVAVFVWGAPSNTGTFQLNQLEVYGIVTNGADCDGTPSATTADSALPSVVYICDTGKRFLNYNIGTGGVAGLDIAYQWQKSTNGTSWTDIDSANGVVYQTPLDTAGVTADTTYYRVKLICTAADSIGVSEPNMVIVAPTVNSGTISGIPAGSGTLPFGRMFIDSTYALSSSRPGGNWRSNDTSVISINSMGVATPHIPGDAIITYDITTGCFSPSKDSAISLHPHTAALYVGRNGNSTTIYRSADAAAGTSGSLITANWGSSTTCGNGGISGLTNTDAAKNDATNGRVAISITAPTGTSFNTTQVTATVRKQPSGAYKYYLGYRTNAGAWTTSSAVNAESDDCGYSHNELTFAAPLLIDDAHTYDFAVFGYNGTATTTLQVNSISIIGNGANPLNRPTGVNELNVANSIHLYPNPAENTLNVDATENVNITIFSIDGKKLLEQKNTKSINVNTLVSGMYIVTVSNTNNMLLKTDKFVKK